MVGGVSADTFLSSSDDVSAPSSSVSLDRVSVSALQVELAQLNENLQFQKQTDEQLAILSSNA